MRWHVFSAATRGQFERILNEAINRENERIYAEATGNPYAGIKRDPTFWFSFAPAITMRKNAEGVWERA